MMKVKRLIIQISFVLVGFFLLSHTVLPHTHHDGIVCLDAEQKCYCENNFSDELDQHKEHHHHHANIEECNLKDFVIRKSDIGHDNQSRFIPDYLSLYHFIHSFIQLCPDAPSVELHLRLKLYSESYTTPFVGSIKSLRAPPVPAFLG